MAGVFKSLDKSDVRITPFRTHKLWSETLETVTNINPNAYAVDSSSLSCVSYPYRHRKDSGPRLYFLDGSNKMVSYQLSANQIAGISAYPVQRDVNYINAVQVYQQSSVAKTNAYIDASNYPSQFSLNIDSTDLTTNIAVTSATSINPYSQQEYVNQIAYHGHSGGVAGTATLYVCTSYRFMFAQLDANHLFAPGLTPLVTYLDTPFADFSFLGAIARSSTTTFIVSYDRPNSSFVLHATTAPTSISNTPKATIQYNNPPLGWSWNEDIRIKHLITDTSNLSVMFTLKNLTSNTPSPIFMMSDGGSSNILNGNFVALLSDTSLWESYNFRSQTNRKVHAVTSEGYIFKGLVYKTSGFTYTEILDLRQYVGAGNEVVDAIITADNDSLQVPGVPKTITMIVRPSGSPALGSHQLVTVNLDTNEVYDPIHLGGVIEGYYYPNDNTTSTFPLGGSNFVANGLSVFGLGGKALASSATQQPDIKLHTFNPNI